MYGDQHASNQDFGSIFQMMMVCDRLTIYSMLVQYRSHLELYSLFERSLFSMKILNIYANQVVFQKKIYTPIKMKNQGLISFILTGNKCTHHTEPVDWAYVVISLYKKMKMRLIPCNIYCLTTLTTCFYSSCKFSFALSTLGKNTELVSNTHQTLPEIEADSHAHPIQITKHTTKHDRN